LESIYVTFRKTTHNKLDGFLKAMKGLSLITENFFDRGNN